MPALHELKCLPTHSAHRATHHRPFRDDIVGIASLDLGDAEDAEVTRYEIAGDYRL